MGSVVQPWVGDLTMMQQSVLLTAVRGPDGLAKYHPVKYVLRWYRRCILLSSFLGQVVDNPIVLDGGSFLGPSVQVAADRGTTAIAWWEPMNDRVTDYIQSTSSRSTRCRTTSSFI